MRGRAIIVSALAACAIATPAFAEKSSSLEPTRGEKLAWHLEAYVPCKTGGALSEMKKEVALFEANRDEMLVALDMLRFDDNACTEIKRASGKLLALALNEPEKFNQTFGFVNTPSQDQIQLAENNAEQPANTAKLKAQSLAPMPQALSLKTRSSY